MQKFLFFCEWWNGFALLYESVNLGRSEIGNSFLSKVCKVLFGTLSSKS